MKLLLRTVGRFVLSGATHLGRIFTRFCKHRKKKSAKTWVENKKTVPEQYGCTGLVVHSGGQVVHVSELDGM